jgi:phage repressor protein C with HTH and peptisase S24 domain
MQEFTTKNLSICERFFQVLDYYGDTRYKFSRGSGISETVLSNIFNKKNKPKAETIETLLNKYKAVNANWLILGEGEMLKSDTPTAIKLPESSNEGIPLIPLDAMAGFGKGDVQVMEYECERYMVPMFKGADFLIQVKGSSMIPKYNSGDIVACKKISLENIFFQWNKVYVIDTDQGALVKRIKKGSDKDHLLIISDNPQFDSFELHMSQIYAVALVIGVIRLE